MVNYFKNEEKLIKTEMTLYNTIKNVETLNKIDALLAKYSVRDSEQLSVKIKTAEHLSKNGKLIMPLKVRGTMLGVGRHKEKYYTAEALRRSVIKHRGKKIPMKVDHRNQEIGATIGVIDTLKWDQKLGVITFEGFIHDETHARNMISGLYSNVSATIYSIKDYSESLGIIGTDLDYDEVSIVKEGAFTGNSIEVE